MCEAQGVWRQGGCTGGDVLCGVVEANERKKSWLPFMRMLMLVVWSNRGKWDVQWGL